MLVHEVQPLMILPPISSSAVQPANRLENEVTLVSPLNSPSGMLFSAEQSWNALANEVTFVLVAKRSEGSFASEVQPENEALNCVTFVKPSNSPAGISVSEVQPLKMLLNAVVVTVSNAPVFENSAPGMLCNSEHPLKQVMKVVTFEHPAKSSAGIEVIFVALNVLRKSVHFLLLAKSFEGMDFRPEPWNV